MDDIETLLDEIEEREDALSNWEREFLDDIQAHLGEGRDLTERQVEKIKEIHAKVS